MLELNLILNLIVRELRGKIYTIIQREGNSCSLMQVRGFKGLRLPGTVFEKGFVCIVHAGEGTTLASALLQWGCFLS